jgi:hypothetical protein
LLGGLKLLQEFNKQNAPTNMSIIKNLFLMIASAF